MPLITETDHITPEFALTGAAPNLWLLISAMGPAGKVQVERKGPDNTFRGYKELSFSSDGARQVSVPAGNYRIKIAGTATVEYIPL